MTKRKAVFLDRDGVLNHSVVRGGKPYPPATVEEVVIFEDAAGALSRLKARGFLLLVVSNQPDVARGTTTQAAVEQIHADLAAALPLDDFFVCYHDDPDRCHCRKPLPGLLTAGADKYGIDTGGSYMIGDRWRDVDAGAAAGCRTIFIDRQYVEREPARKPDKTVTTLSEAVDWILEQEKQFEPSFKTQD